MMRSEATTIEETMALNEDIDREKERLWNELLGFRDSVFLLCLGFTHDTADARDLTQESYTKALTHSHTAPRDHLKPWLLRIARNTCFDHARRKKVRREFQSGLPPETVDCRTPESEAGRDDQIRIVRNAILRLSRKLRDVLVLREYGELSYEEIGQILGRYRRRHDNVAPRPRPDIVATVHGVSHGRVPLPWHWPLLAWPLSG